MPQLTFEAPKWKGIEPGIDYGSVLSEPVSEIRHELGKITPAFPEHGSQVSRQDDCSGEEELRGIHGLRKTRHSL